MASVGDGYNGGGTVGVVQLAGTLPTYQASFSNINNTVAIGTTMGFAALWHTSASTKTVRLTRVWVTVKSNGTLANLVLGLRRTTTQVPAGGTAVTPAPLDPRNAAVDSTVETNNADLWTAGTSPAYVAQSIYNAAYWRNTAFTTGTSGAAPAWGAGVQLYQYQPQLGQPIILRPGVTEGIVLAADTEAGTSLTLGGGFEWTEE